MLNNKIKWDNGQHVRNMRESNSGRIDFDIENQFWHSEPLQHFHTNDKKEGLWTGYDYNKQIAGTLDFSLKQTSTSGKYKAIRRYFFG